MNISKNKKLSIIAVFIILAVYNMVAFVFPFNRSGMFWTGYGFSMIAIILTAGVGFYVVGHEGLRSKVYGCSLISLVWRYLIVQLTIGLLEMFLSSIPFQYGLVLNVILLGACLIGLVAIDIGKEEIEHIDEKIKEKIFYIRSLQAEVEGMVNKSVDAATQKILKDLAEVIRYSDPMSSQQLASIENRIEAKIVALAEVVETSDIVTIKNMCDEVQRLIAERNRKCKLLK